MSTKSFHYLLGSLLAVFAGTCAASERPSLDPFPLTARSAEEFRDQADELRDALQPAGKHAAVDADGKAKIERQLVLLQALYDRHDAGQRTDSIASQAEVVNAAETINGVLVGDQADRVVCQLMKPVGSNRTQKVCQTVNDREKRRRESQLAHRDMIKWMPIQDTNGE